MSVLPDAALPPHCDTGLKQRLPIPDTKSPFSLLRDAAFRRGSDAGLKERLPSSNTKAAFSLDRDPRTPSITTPWPPRTSSSRSPTASTTAPSISAPACACLRINSPTTRPPSTRASSSASRARASCTLGTKAACTCLDSCPVSLSMCSSLFGTNGRIYTSFHFNTFSHFVERLSVLLFLNKHTAHQHILGHPQKRSGNHHRRHTTHGRLQCGSAA